MDRPTFVIIFLSVVIFILLLFRLFLLSELGARNIEYYLYTQRIEKVKAQNKVLNEQILNERSFNALYERAIKEGFVPATNSDYLYLQ